jgi:hypothetical protein
MQNLHNDLHPVEALLLVALVVAQAVVELAVALVALTTRTASAPAAPPSPPAPTVHPLQPVAESVIEDLAPLTVAQLRRRARDAGLPRCLSRGGRRDALLEALAGLEVAWG